MENDKMVKQMIDYHKAAFETSFNSVVMLQEQTTRAMDNILQLSPVIPEQTKAFVNEWKNIYKKATADFKEAADQNYSKLEKLLIPGVEMPKPKAKK